MTYVGKVGNSSQNLFYFNCYSVNQGSWSWWPRGLGRKVTGIVGLNPARGTCVLCCRVWVEAFVMGWSLIQRSPTNCLTKITKPPVWGGPGPYMACRATDDDEC
jgi:hypothetical protein